MSKTKHKIVIRKTTSAVAYTSPLSFEFDLDESSDGKAALRAGTLAGSEVVYLYVYNPDIGDYQPARDESGNAVILTATAPEVPLSFRGPYKADKSATASACSVWIAFA